MLARLARKIRDVWRYPPLAWRGSDCAALLLLGLFRNRVISLQSAALMTRGGSGVIHPRLRATNGEPVRVDLRDLEQVDTFDELFLHQVYNFALVPFAPDLIVDCGAFCGYFSAMAGGNYRDAQVVAFEPDPANIAKLEAQIACLSHPPKLIRAAACDRDGEIEFAGSGVGGSIVRHGGAAVRKVPCVDFPAWLRSQAPLRLVWKLDVEGAEKMLLEASLGLLPRQSVVFLETHYSDRDCVAMLQPYRAAGFSITEVRRRKAMDGDYCYVEWVMVRNV